MKYSIQESPISTFQQAQNNDLKLSRKQDNKPLNPDKKRVWKQYSRQVCSWKLKSGLRCALKMAEIEPRIGLESKNNAGASE